MSTIARRLADFAVNLEYEDLTPETVLEAKRFLLDSLGCALRGNLSQDFIILSKVLKELGGTPEASIIGDDLKTNCYNAAFANSLLIRVLDYNDIYWRRDASHPSDLIPAALSVGEREHKSGRDLITAIIIAYELEMRLCEFAVPGIGEKKWHHASLTQFVSPIVAGKILELNEDQICNAIGISGCHNLTLGAITAGKLTMMKNIADPMATQSGVIAALMAEKGFTGPETIFEGKRGLIDTLDGRWNIDRLLNGLGDRFKIGECSMKAFPTEALTHSPITATLKLIRDYDLKPTEIEKVTVKTNARAVENLADSPKYRPTTKETADHSLPYCIAAAVVDQEVTLEQFTEDKLKDKKIKKFINKVKVVLDPEIEKLFPELKPTIVEIKTKSGKHYALRVDFPLGDPKNRMSDEEVLKKFKNNASPLIDKDKQNLIISAIMKLDEFKDINQLTKLLRKS